MSTDVISELVAELASSPTDPELNFKLGLVYEEMQQPATAVSFFLRAAEYGVDAKSKKVVYTSLLKMSECFTKQGGRVHSVTNALQQAIAYWPERPEGYFLLSRFYELAGNWQECYTWASVGSSYAPEAEDDSLPVYTGYDGKYCLEFQKAVSSWWIGRKDESKDMLMELVKGYSLNETYRDAVVKNLKRMGVRLETFIDINSLEPLVMNYRKFFGSTAELIFDIGTRDGDDALYLKESLNSTEVHVVDANENCYNATVKKHPYFAAHFTAMSNYNGVTSFQKVDSDDVTQVGCSSIYARKVAELEEFRGKVEMVEVPVVTMKQLLANIGRSDSIIDLVKVDIEGYTWEFLEGLGTKIKDVKILHLETEREATHPAHKNSDEIAFYMMNNNFYLADLSYEWGWGIQDQVWVNKALAVNNRECF